MAGYSRVDTANNIADGNVISAADLDGEFDGVQAAFNSSTGHTHGGADGEGAPITKVGPTNDVTISNTAVLPKTTATVSLGSSLLKFKDLHLSGDATIAGTVTAVLTNSTGLPIVNGTTGTLSVARGGTGSVTLTENSVLLGNGTSALQVVAPSTAGNVLTSDGTTWQSSAPIAQVYPAAGIPVSTGTSWGTSKTTPTGDIVGTSDTQTLSNKSVSLGNNTVSGTIAQFNTALTDGDFATINGTETLSNKTINGLVLNDGYTEEVFAVTGTTPALSPTNGSIQTWTLTGNSTPTAGTWAAGQSITLMVDDGTAYTITWTSLAVTWKTDGGSAPTLNTTGFTAIALWKVGTTIYGARVGNA